MSLSVKEEHPIKSIKVASFSKLIKLRPITINKKTIAIIYLETI
ncbi:hypothetical protein SRABI27_04825 [Pedobacter sp. Bi27]|nr:hypothetical protein SRABI36_03909 [Pedobacter sp. Bi36]CAH0295032.1 hypothetical protein SRABI126_04175 [Pedobacter sp. Bi126]CAH0312014.1 hypothetical protein SRABI27_04825 [Pedobacter sp. Bi27]